MKSPKVSICIPTYQQVDYLRKTLESILIQIFCDYEVIVTDDSSDNSVQELIEEYDFQGRLNYVKNEFCLGAPKNWNKSIRLARGEYIKLMHHDDWFVDNNSLTKFVDLLDKNAEAVFGFSACLAYESDSGRFWLHRATKDQLNLLSESPNKLLFGNFVGAPSCTIYRKSLMQEYDISLKWLVDIDFYIRALCEKKNFAFCSEPLVCNRSGSKNQLTATCFNNKEVELFEYIHILNKLYIKSAEVKEFEPLLSSLFKKYHINSFQELSLFAVIHPKLESWVRDLMRKSHIWNFNKHLKLLPRKLKTLTNFIIRPTLHRPKIKKESFSQCGEDLIIKYIFDALNLNTPSYLDIGAHDPEKLNNTAIFYLNGSRGINIEPDPFLFQKFPLQRSKDVNLNIGISTAESELDFYIMSARTLNTFSKEEAEKYVIDNGYRIDEVKRVKVDTVQSVISRYWNNKFPDLLSVDVEGLEQAIIESIDYENNYPIVICVETISFSMTGNGCKNKSLIDFLDDKGYMVYADTNINTIFVRKDKWIR